MVIGAAWVTPAVLVATSSPPAAASGGAGEEPPPCVDSDLGAAAAVTPLDWEVTSGALHRDWRTTGWTPASDDDAAAISVPNNWWSISGPGFLSMDDNLSSSAPAEVTARYTFEASSAVVYRLSLDLRTGYGSDSGWISSRQRMTLTADGTHGSTALLSLAVAHPADKGRPTGSPSDDEVAAQGYALLPIGTATRDVLLSGVSGLVTLTFTFTVDPVIDARGHQVSDDIWVSKPSVVQAGCT